MTKNINEIMEKMVTSLTETFTIYNLDGSLSKKDSELLLKIAITLIELPSLVFDNIDNIKKVKSIIKNSKNMVKEMENTNLKKQFKNILNSILEVIEEISKDVDVQEENIDGMQVKVIREVPGTGSNSFPLGNLWSISTKKNVDNCGINISGIITVQSMFNDNNKIKTVIKNLPYSVNPDIIIKLLKDSGLLMTEEILNELGADDKFELNLRVIYSKNSIVPLFTDIRTTAEMLESKSLKQGQRLVVLEKSGKGWELPEYMNPRSLDWKEVVPKQWRKTIKNFSKNKTFSSNDLNVLPDIYAIDEYNNFYVVGVPYIKKGK
jgi:hypothetical protein